MCNECMRHPCHPRCPNAEEKPVCTCAICGEVIYEGEEMYAIGDDTFCVNCIEDFKTYAE